MIAEWPALALFVVVCLVLMAGYPVFLTLAGTALMFAAVGTVLGSFDSAFLTAFPNRVFGIMTNEVLLAVPLFVFMGVVLERSEVAQRLLHALALLWGPWRGGLGISVIMVGALLAASTGIVGATVVTMGLLALPTMLRQGYDPAVATGTVCAAGTLGQIIPPSIVLVLLGDVLSAAYQQAQLDLGQFAPATLSVGDLFAGALLPGLLLVAMYVAYLSLWSSLRPRALPVAGRELSTTPGGQANIALVKALLPPLALMMAVLGSILGGLATPTEAAAIGAAGALVIAASQRRMSLARLCEVSRRSARITAMVFAILIGAALFSLTFRGYGGDDLVRRLLTDLPGGTAGAVTVVMLMMFALGFFLDFIEITFVVVPIVAPVLLTMDVDPVWLGVMIAVNLQTSFLTPPFGFALFYLRGVAPTSVTTGSIYRGVVPFVLIQLAMLLVLACFPVLATWLPTRIYG